MRKGGREETLAPGGKVVLYKSVDGLPGLYASTRLGIIIQYLRRVLTVSDNYWLAVISNLWKSRHNLDQMLRIMEPEREDDRTSGTFHKAAVHVVILFVSEA